MIIETRGTGEAQGPSAEFVTMNKAILSQVIGSQEYDTIYPASEDQNSTEGTLNVSLLEQKVSNACY